MQTFEMKTRDFSISLNIIKIYNVLDSIIEDKVSFLVLYKGRSINKLGLSPEIGNIWAP